MPKLESFKDHSREYFINIAAIGMFFQTIFTKFSDSYAPLNVIKNMQHICIA